MKTLLFGTLISACALSAALAAEDATRDFQRYQVIIDRMPFGGQLGGAAGNNAAPFASRFVLVGLVSANGPGGELQAVISDKSVQNRIYFKGEGETVDGVKVVKINPDLPNRSVVLQQGLETATLTFPERREVVPPRRPAGVPGLPGMPAAVDAAPAAENPPTTAPASATPPRRIPFRR